MAAETPHVFPAFVPAGPGIFPAKDLVARIPFVEFQKVETGAHARTVISIRAVGSTRMRQANQQVIQIAEQPAALHAGFVIDCGATVSPVARR